MSRPTDKGVETGFDPRSVVALVAAFVSHNALPQAELPGFIAAVHTALRQVATGRPQPDERPAVPAAQVPAVSIRKSVTDEFIVCLEDGGKYRSLKRHLSSKYGLTPDAYRVKWGLPADYPMVAPGYAAKRSELAKQAGLGSKLKKAPAKGQAAKPVAKGAPASQAA